MIREPAVGGYLRGNQGFGVQGFGCVQGCDRKFRGLRFSKGNQGLGVEGLGNPKTAKKN